MTGGEQARRQRAAYGEKSAAIFHIITQPDLEMRQSEIRRERLAVAPLALHPIDLRGASAMIPGKLNCLIVCLLGLIYPNSAFAHSFNQIFFAPSSSQQAESVERGFRLAAREQDAHAFEESDGHLGGLDVYLIRIEASQTREDLERIVREAQPLFAYGIAIEADASAILERAGVIAIKPEDARFWAAIEQAPHALTRFDGSAFVNGYRAAHGGEPDATALRAYVAARIVAAVVRESSEHDRRRPERLRAILQRVLQRERL